MSPEDDHLQGEQQTNNTDGHNNDEHWSSAKHASPKNGVMSSIGNSGYINSNAILKQNSGDSHTWLPLLNHHHANDIPATNNNKWPVLTAPSNLSNSKYVWRELPQDDDSMGLYKPNLNTTNALSNGNGLNGKSEHESLTGVVRHSLNDYSNDEYHERSDCGIGICKPRWARMFASTHVFMVVFLLAWILQVIFMATYRQSQNICFNRVNVKHSLSISLLLFAHTHTNARAHRECILHISLVSSQPLRNCFKSNQKQPVSWWVLLKLDRSARRYFWLILQVEDIALDGLRAVICLFLSLYIQVFLCKKKNNSAHLNNDSHFILFFSFDIYSLD